VNKTSLESTAQDNDFQEVKWRKGHISNVTLQIAKKSTKPVPTSAAVNLPLKAVSTRKFFAPLRTTGAHTETTREENTLPEKEPPRKSGRPPPIVMTSTTILIHFQRDLKDHVRGECEFRNTRMEHAS
jgi:hypothetical protein